MMRNGYKLWLRRSALVIATTMDRKLSLVLFVLLTFLALAQAEFYYNRKKPSEDDLPKGLKCVPGRTWLKVKNQNLFDVPKRGEDPTDDEDEPVARSHMNQKTTDESCKVCVCSVEGKDEYCSNRPARNVNECLRMAMVMEQFKTGGAFNHERILSYMIRRDYLWHNDEIPYDSEAKCQRGHSFYTNNPDANDTKVNVDDEVETNLDYNDTNICFFCICSVSGYDIACINRHVWFCDQIRNSRDSVKIRDRYRILFQQDRPTYFRSLSWRMRRTLDSGIYALIENGGDAMCCDHPSGHRRSLHNRVDRIFRNLRRRVPKENLMSGSPGGDYVDFIVNNDK